MRSGKPPAPKPVKQLVREVTDALGARNLARPVNAEYRPADPSWKVSARKIEVRLDSSFPGKWRLNMSWSLVPVPPDSDLVVQESSIGLYGAKVPALGGGEEEVCLVRYDTSHSDPGPTLEPLGAHINVFQPRQLEDKVHYKLPGLPEHDWPLGEVLDFLLSARLVEDLTNRLH
jgi:hypothetical protein